MKEKTTVEQRFAFLAALGACIDWDEITSAELQEMIRGAAAMEGTAFVKNKGRVTYWQSPVINMDAPSKRVSANWQVLPEHQLPNRMSGLVEWNPANTALYFSEKQTTGKMYIGGNDLRKELEELQGLHATDMVIDFYLDHEEVSTSKEWLGKWIYAWGRIYRCADDYLIVRCLFCRYDGSRYDDYHFVSDIFRSNDPALVVAGK